MSGENSEEDAGASVEEWRVEPAGPAQTGIPAADDASDWSVTAVSLRCAQVSADLSGWREELNQRMRRLEERLRRAGAAGD
jgi:hypothetical protein